MMPDRENVINRMEAICNICKEKTWRTEFSSDTIFPLLQDVLSILKEQEAVEAKGHAAIFASLVVDWLREIAYNNIDCNREMTFLDAIEDIRDRASYGLKAFFADKLMERSVKQK